jgi:hypothetical protein
MTIFACCVLAAAALSASATANASDCDLTSSKVAAAVSDLTFVNRIQDKDGIGGEVHFSHPAGTVEIICLNGVNPGVTVYAPTAYPSKELIEIAAKAGAADTGRPEQVIRNAINKCFRQYAKSGDDEIEISGASILCSTYSDPFASHIQVMRR